MVGLAYADEGARSWLAEAQQADGSIGARVGSIVRDVTALGVLALPPGAEREAGLGYVVGLAGQNGEDPTVRTAGWPWTVGAHGWTEPTAWGLMAARLRPTATDRRADALAFFGERECDDGGWNYGAPETLGIPIGPYVQTSALATLALGQDAPDLTTRGVAFLERRWSSESDGVLSLATAVCALQLARSSSTDPARRMLLSRAHEGDRDTIATAWIALATSSAHAPWSMA